MFKLTLKPGREKSLLRRHPWVFSGAIANIQGDPDPGETVEIFSSKGQILARGAYSPYSQIVARVWSFEPDEEIDVNFFASRLQRAIAARGPLAASQHLTAYRLVNAESDFLPGLIVDRYADFLVCQFLSSGSEYWKQEIVTQLAALSPCQGIYERSDAEVRQKEGLPFSASVLFGDAPPAWLEILEGKLRFAVDLQQGHKTGFYLDQRENRMALADYARGTDVLNCFAYTGGFGIYALKHGASSVVNIDTSADVLDAAQRNTELNNLDQSKAEYIQGDVFQVLRSYRNAGRQFDLIVLDPPKFVESRKHLKRACRGYKDINWLAMRLLRPGGFLFTFSCSGLMPLDLFQKIVADAALDAGREAHILHRLFQSSDHPVALNFPEGMYLKGLICQVW